MPRFAVPEPDIAVVAERVARSLELPLELRSSEYLGGGEGEVRVLHNVDPMHDPHGGAPPEEFYVEPDYASYPLLIDIEGTDATKSAWQAAVRAAIPTVVLVSREDAG